MWPLFVFSFFSAASSRCKSPCSTDLVVFLIHFIPMSRAIYASTLAYIVDANGGRSSLAVATNSFFRGVSAFVAIEIAVPLQVSLLWRASTQSY